MNSFIPHLISIYVHFKMEISKLEAQRGGHTCYPVLTNFHIRNNLNEATLILGLYWYLCSA